MKKELLLWVILVFQMPVLHAQLKYEREYRLDESQVPKQALDFIDSLKFFSKVKWYKEENLNKNSVEAKFKYESQKYSVEFDTSGVIEDIELQIQWDEIPSNTQNTISAYFKSNYDKHKVWKIQRQYVGSADSLLQIRSKKTRNLENIVIRYEIVAKVKKEKKHQKLELLFDKDGGLIQKSVIIFKNTDNLEY